MPGLFGMAARTDAEMMIRRRQTQIGKDRIGHVGIIMLTGMDQDRLKVWGGSQRVPERRDFHEVGPRSGNHVNSGNASHTYCV